MTKPRILIVEDEAIIAMDIEEALLSLNYAIAGKAQSGEEALELMEKLSPVADLVLMDINLAGEMDGIEAAERITKRHSVPVVFLTAFADKPTLDRAKILEPYGYILKPFRPTELRTVVELALHRYSVDKKRDNTQDLPRAAKVPVPDFVRIVNPSNLPSALMQSTIRSYLESLPPFNELGPEMLSAVASVSMVQSFKNYETIVHEGQERTTGFLVMDGRAAVYKTSTGGKELIVELLGPSDLFGLLAVLERAPFPFSARAHGVTRALMVPGAVIYHITENYPQVSRELFHRVLERLRKAHDLSRALAHDKVEVRVASALLAMKGTFAHPQAVKAAPGRNDDRVFELEMTRQELGELTGTSPETVSRILNRMESEGVVDLSQPGKVRIMREEQLSSLMA